MNRLENKTILVTGGAGFIGSHTIEQLLKSNVKHIKVLDNLATGKMENIQHLLDGYANFEFIPGDIINIDDCKRAVQHVDVICHLAALISVPLSIEEPLLTHQINATGFLNILIAAKEVGIKRIVYASSAAVYGDDDTLPKIEDKIGNILSPYGATKFVNEIYANLFTKCYGLECIGLRYFNVFGMRQDPSGPYAAAVPKFIQCVQNNDIPIIYGDGNNTRDFVYIDNIVNANILAMTTNNSKCYGKVFNIGTGEHVTILNLFQIIKKEYSSDIEPTFRDKRNGDIEHSFPNIGKATENLEYTPSISIENGIKQLIKETKFIN